MLPARLMNRPGVGISDTYTLIQRSYIFVIKNNAYLKSGIGEGILARGVDRNPDRGPVAAPFIWTARHLVRGLLEETSEQSAMNNRLSSQCKLPGKGRFRVQPAQNPRTRPPYFGKPSP